MHLTLYYFRLWYGNLLYLSFQAVSRLSNCHSTQDTLLVLSYVRLTAYTQLIKQFLLLLVQGKPLFKHRGYRFHNNVEPFNTYYPLYELSLRFLTSKVFLYFSSTSNTFNVLRRAKYFQYKPI